MRVNKNAIFICDDWISVTLDTTEYMFSACQTLRKSGDWKEVVPGITSLAVQFDPADIMPEEAASNFHNQLEKSEAHVSTKPPPITIPVCYDADFAPDREEISEIVDTSADDLAEWHSGHKFTVSMLGFMPGFAYLSSKENIPDIGRLSKPRQHVVAGSIGIIGSQSCIYSFDSPGGWPIIGRTPIKLFDVAKESPALLSASQLVRFEAINRERFEHIVAGYSQ